jgi:uncharacterized LabA/DUF88 family protein
LLIPCDSIREAVFIEAKIKKMKSRKYIEDLARYPEMIDKLKKIPKNKTSRSFS